jgi:alkaline phosphatase
MKKIILPFLLIFSLFGGNWAALESDNEIRSIILMIPDGFSIEGTTFVRWMNDGKALAWDPHVCGLVRTFSADSPITDSAPAATAYATGHKSHTGFIAVLPDQATMPGTHPIEAHQARAPLMTILEAAGLLGKSTGIVATSEVQHATPAAFTAHTPSRKGMDDIAEQQVYNGLDLVLGGGGDFLDPRKRADREDLTIVLKRLGYSLVRNVTEMRDVRSGRLWGVFDARAMTCDKSRNPEIEPSLAEMTAKAIEILSQNEKGFFLMVEGSQIDWAGHGNDPVAYAADALAFDRAVQGALDFARQDGHTVVIVVSDHGTGGISFGSATSNQGYDTRALGLFVDPLKKALISAHELEKEILKMTDEGQVRHALQTRYALEDLSDPELARVMDYCADVKTGRIKSGKLDAVIGPMLSKRAAIGWTTTGHVGGDVALAVYHPTGDRPMGVIDNTDVNRYMQRLFGLNLDELTSRYFLAAQEAFEGIGARVVVDTSRAANPVLRVRKGRKSLIAPAHKNTVWLNGRLLVMPTVTVYNGQRFFVSREMVELLEK